MDLLFVYGSLRKGAGFHHYLGGAQYIEKDILHGYIMLNTGEYPVIIKSQSEDDSVVIEIYRIDRETLCEIDRFEGYYGDGKHNEYERIRARSSKGYEGFVYTGTEMPGAITGRVVKSGDWMDGEK